MDSTDLDWKPVVINAGKFRQHWLNASMGLQAAQASGKEKAETRLKHQALTQDLR